MKLASALLLGFLGFAGAHAAEPAPRTSGVAWDLATVELVRTASAERGKALHAPCAGCHGVAGISPTSEFPDLAGQPALYVFKQLQDFKSGARPNAIMSEFVTNLSDRALADLAAYYAIQKPATAALGPVSDATTMLVRIGDGGRMIVACEYCHGAGGTGNTGMYGMPTLRGQKGAYLQQTLEAFRAGTRHNDIYGVMRNIARKLSAQEIAQLASYYSGTAVAPREPSVPSPASAAAAHPAAPTSAAPRPTLAPGAGWYTDAQAARGAPLYAQSCAACHGANLEGGMGPRLVGSPFWQAWGGKPFDRLWRETHAKMPLTAPGSQSAPVSLDVLAFILQRNGVPAGTSALTDDADLARALPTR